MMHLKDDIERIETILEKRMARGWVKGDPASITLRPIMSRRRCYLVGFRNDTDHEQWMVDASEPGIVLRPAGDCRESRARADVLVAILMRLLRRRTAPKVLRNELARLEASAESEGYDFQTLFEVAATQCAGFQLDLETLISAEQPKKAA